MCSASGFVMHLASPCARCSAFESARQPSMPAPVRASISGAPNISPSSALQRAGAMPHAAHAAAEEQTNHARVPACHRSRHWPRARSLSFRAIHSGPERASYRKIQPGTIARAGPMHLWTAGVGVGVGGWGGLCLIQLRCSCHRRSGRVENSRSRGRIERLAPA